jgi:hypothetical protein
MHLALWGTVDTNSNTLDMTVGLPASTLVKAGLRGLPPTYVLPVAVSGPLHRPQVEWNAAGEAWGTAFLRACGQPRPDSQPEATFAKWARAPWFASQVCSVRPRLTVCQSRYVLLLKELMFCCPAAAAVRQLAVLSAMQFGREAWRHEGERVERALWGAAVHEVRVLQSGPLGSAAAGRALLSIAGCQVGLPSTCANLDSI